MRRFLFALIGFVYVIGLGFSGQAAAYTPAIKIQVKHNHVVVAGHHHHQDIISYGDHDEHSDRSHKHGSQGEHASSVPHSHEVSVSIINAFVTNSTMVIPVAAIVPPEDAAFLILNDSLPEDISLRSIFRPPIAA